MRIVFMGSPGFALPALMALRQAGHDLCCVYSQPAKPAGRGQALRPTPVAAFARDAGLEVRTPKSLKGEKAQAAFAELRPDLAVVVAYGLILPPPILAAPVFGCINLHASLLPRWRGAAPIQRAIMAGDAQTGVAIMQMEEGLDTGPVFAQAATPIGPEDTAERLHDRLAALGAPLLVEVVSGLEAGKLSPQAQPQAGILYAHKIAPADARIDWTLPAAVIDRQIRGLSPHPGAWFLLDSEKGPVRIKALGARLEAASGEPGAVLDHALLIACGSGALRLSRVQKEGRQALDSAEFLRGWPVPAGKSLR